MNLHREILRLSVPSILANITVPLVGMVDIAVAGHLGASGSLGAAALIGGISIGTMLFDMLYWNFGFLRAGTGGLTAQAYGKYHAGVREAAGEIAATLRRALGIAFGAGLLLIALQWAVVQVAFLLVDCSGEVQTLATQYFYIRIWAAPATLSLFAFKGWFIGMQDTVRPMVCDLVVNTVNVLLSVGLAFGYAGLPELGFAGVAWGTFCAQWTGFLYALLALRSHYGALFQGAKPAQNATAGRPGSRDGVNNGLKRRLRETLVSLRAQKRAETQPAGDRGWRAFFALNRDLFLRSVCMIAVYIGFTMISARYGDLTLAVGAILMKLLMFFSYFTDGFAYAGEALTGRFIGEGSPDGVRSTIRQTFFWSLVVTGLFFLVYGAGGVPLLRLMTDDPSVVEAGRSFIPWLLLMPLIGCPAFTWDGIFTGATASRDLRNSTAWCVVGFFAVWFAGERAAGALAGTGGPGPEAALHILMAAYFTHLAVRAAYLTLRWRKAIPYA